MKCGSFMEVVTFGGFAVNLSRPFKEVAFLNVSYAIKSLLLHGMGRFRELAVRRDFISP